MGKMLITGDLHLGHANIIKYANRPFKNIEHMDKELIRRWNEKVSDKDTVIHNGDFCFKSKSGKGNGEGISFNEWRSKLNGNIIFIRGNHDKRSNGLVTPISNMTLRFGGHDIFVTHRPQDANFNYSINFTAHSHDDWNYKILCNGEKKILLINVGCDQWDFYPQSMGRILDTYKKYL